MSIEIVKQAYRSSLRILCAGLLSAALLPALHADGWNKSTKVTFNDPVQIPGQVLPAGTYVFRLLDSPADRHVVQIFDANGQHLGGLIAPGIHMMREALMNKTSDIAKAVSNSTPSLAGVLANNTVGAVSRGAVFALAGMADRAAEVVEQSTRAKPKLFITGGDAGMITGTMRSQGEIVPDLVLQGLAVIAAQGR